MAQTLAVDLVIEWGEVFDSYSKDHNTRGDGCFLGVYFILCNSTGGKARTSGFVSFIQIIYYSRKCSNYGHNKLVKFPF